MQEWASWRVDGFANQLSDSTDNMPHFRALSCKVRAMKTPRIGVVGTGSLQSGLFYNKYGIEIIFTWWISKRLLPARSPKHPRDTLISLKTIKMVYHTTSLLFWKSPKTTLTPKNYPCNEGWKLFQWTFWVWSRGFQLKKRWCKLGYFDVTEAGRVVWDIVYVI